MKKVILVHPHYESFYDKKTRTAFEPKSVQGVTRAVAEVDVKDDKELQSLYLGRGFVTLDDLATSEEAAGVAEAGTLEHYNSLKAEEVVAALEAGTMQAEAVEAFEATRGEKARKSILAALKKIEEAD